MFAHLRFLTLIFTVSVAFCGAGTANLATSAVAQPAPALDLPAMTIRPTDLEHPGWLHQGAYLHAVSDQARDHADYIGRGTDAEEVEERLTAIGWQRQYVSFLSLPSDADPATAQQVIRSYVTEYATADSAAAGFAYLEDESLVGAATDLPLDRVYGQQSELTSERGIGGQDGRQFRSVDLTFRLGNLVAGITLIQYPTADRIDPDSALAERLAAIVEARVGGPAQIASALGAAVVRLEHEQSEVVTFDDAYYRAAGVDTPIAGESAAAATARAETYANAEDVYQLWQGIDTDEVNGALYGVTLLSFPEESAAEAWLNDLADILATNPFYGDIRSEPVNVAIGDQTVALSYAAGGGSSAAPRSLILAVRVGADIARVHLVPQGSLDAVPMTALIALVTTQADCLALNDCQHTVVVPVTLIDALTAREQATPVAD